MVTVRERKLKIIEMCKKPKTSAEVAQAVGLGCDYVRRYLRPMVKLGVLEKVGDFSKPNNHGVKYIATGEPLPEDQPKVKQATYNTGFTIMGVRL